MLVSTRPFIFVTPRSKVSREITLWAVLHQSDPFRDFNWVSTRTRELPNSVMPTITKKEAYLKRGGAEMAKIMSNEAARRKMLNHQRPHTVSDLESLKYGHSAQLGKHVRETADTYKSRERIILQQRYVG